MYLLLGFSILIWNLSFHVIRHSDELPVLDLVQKYFLSEIEPDIDSEEKLVLQPTST